MTSDINSEDREILTMPESKNQSGTKDPNRILLIFFAVILILLVLTTIFSAYAAFNPKANTEVKLVYSPNDKTVQLQIDGKIDIDIEKSCKKDDKLSCAISDKQRFDCHPEPNANEEKCLARGCCWIQSEESTVADPTVFTVGLPSCFYPDNFVGYEVVKTSNTQSGILAKLKRKTPSGFPLDIQEIQVKVSFMDENRVNIKITDPNAVRYEVPFPKLTAPMRGKLEQLNYDVKLDDNGNLSVIRKSTGNKIFDANLSTMIFANQLLQLNIKVPLAGFYGIGENKDHLRRGYDWKRYVLFNRDRMPEENLNLYGAHPFYLQMESNGNSHGVFLFNSNSMDIVTQPTPAITFRPIGGVFDFYVFLGPSPANVVQQYTALIGHPNMPPFWSLGFQLCRWGYGTTEETRKAWQRTRDAEIPFDVQWNDIDYMDSYDDFTVNDEGFKGLGEFVKEIHAVGMKYVMIMDVGVGAKHNTSYPPFDDGVEMDIFVKNSSGDILYGQVWNKGATVFPDYTHPRAGEYMTKQYGNLHKILEFDGAWIDMNEPSNFNDGSAEGCPDSSLENPQYVPGSLEPLRTKTLCMSAQHHASIHYNVHNIHGFTNGIATNIALKAVLKKRPFIISRSTAPGQGFYTGHWDGDINSSWDHMRWTIPSILNFGMFGFSMMGGDICGFNGNTTVELCARWQALGAFYPFSRNHNTIGTIDQDPVALGDDVTSSAKKALMIRYHMLPFLYTLFYRAHVFGETVARSLFFEFPEDNKTYSVDETFLWGPALLIIPVLQENVRNVTAYIPNDIWYDYHTGEQVKDVGMQVTFDAPIDKINLLLRGGHIIPMQEPAMTTTLSRKNKFGLFVVLKDGKSKGELYWDDGDSLDTYQNKKYNLISFSVADKNLSSVVEHSQYNEQMVLDNIKIFGLEKPQKVFLNNNEVESKYTDNNKVLEVDSLKQNLLNPFFLRWE